MRGQTSHLGVPYTVPMGGLEPRAEAYQKVPWEVLTPYGLDLFLLRCLHKTDKHVSSKLDYKSKYYLAYQWRGKDLTTGASLSLLWVGATCI